MIRSVFPARWYQILLLTCLLPALGAISAFAARDPDRGPEARAAQAASGDLVTGLTEFSPYLIGPVPTPERLRGSQRRVGELRPSLVRIVVEWDRVQPSALRRPNWDLRQPGCARGLHPCVPWRGVRDQLRAIRARQRAQGGLEAMVVLSGTPRWARRSAYGCQNEDAGGERRGVTREGLVGYRRLVVSLAALGRREGVNLRWWSARNEPNSSFFLAPQRLRCSPRAPSVSAALYAPLVRSLRAALRVAPGRQSVVLGELASPRNRRPGITESHEFVRALPRDVVCTGAVWSLHQYVGDANDLPLLKRVVDGRRCPGPPPRFWITETGAGLRRDPGGGLGMRNVSPEALRAGCRAQHQLLLGWHADPRVDVALQYTYREDPGFTVGLADPGLDDVYPTFALWRAWGQRPPGSPPPALPGACQG